MLIGISNLNKSIIGRCATHFQPVLCGVVERASTTPLTFIDAKLYPESKPSMFFMYFLAVLYDERHTFYFG